MINPEYLPDLMIFCAHSSPSHFHNPSVPEIQKEQGYAFVASSVLVQTSDFYFLHKVSNRKFSGCKSCEYE